MAKFKKTLLWTLCLLPIAVAAGISVSFYTLDTYPEDIVAEMISQFGSVHIYVALGTVQTCAYVLFCGFSGCIIAGTIASVLYGGIVEELMLRLLLMSLICLIIWKLFYKTYTKENIPAAVFAIGNIISSLAFAAGHLPGTISLFGSLTPLIVLRCFLVNGGFGLIFGWLYKKYGICCSMISHALAHIVSKLIWFALI